MSIFLASVFALLLFAAPRAVLLVTAIAAEHGASEDTLELTFLHRRPLRRATVDGSQKRQLNGASLCISS